VTDLAQAIVEHALYAVREHQGKDGHLESQRCVVSWAFLARLAEECGSFLQIDASFLSDDPLPSSLRWYVIRFMLATRPEHVRDALLADRVGDPNELYRIGKAALTSEPMRPQTAQLCFHQLTTRWSYQSIGAFRVYNWLTSLEFISEAFVMLHSSGSPLLPRTVDTFERAISALRLLGDGVEPQLLCIELWSRLLKTSFMIRSLGTEVGLHKGRLRAKQLLNDVAALCHGDRKNWVPETIAGRVSSSLDSLLGKIGTSGV